MELLIEENKVLRRMVGKSWFLFIYFIIDHAFSYIPLYLPMGRTMIPPLKTTPPNSMWCFLLPSSVRTPNHSPSPYLLSYLCSPHYERALTNVSTTVLITREFCWYVEEGKGRMKMRRVDFESRMYWVEGDGWNSC